MAFDSHPRAPAWQPSVPEHLWRPCGPGRRPRPACRPISASDGPVAWSRAWSRAWSQALPPVCWRTSSPVWALAWVPAAWPSWALPWLQVSAPVWPPALHWPWTWAFAPALRQPPPCLWMAAWTQPWARPGRTPAPPVPWHAWWLRRRRLWPAPSGYSISLSHPFSWQNLPAHAFAWRNRREDPRQFHCSLRLYPHCRSLRNRPGLFRRRASLPLQTGQNPTNAKSRQSSGSHREKLRGHQTRLCSSPCKKMSRGRSMPMKTILLDRVSAAVQGGPRSLPIS